MINNASVTKPPIGIMPKWIWLELLETNEPSEAEIKNRIKELKSAIARYQKSEFEPKDDWFFELAYYGI